MPIKVSVNIDYDRINSRINHSKKAAANQLLIESDRYVPRRQGTLRQSGRVSNDGGSVIWDTPYAHYQYMGVSKLGKTGWNYTTPGTGPKWDKKVKGDANAMNNISNAIKRSF